MEYVLFYNEVLDEFCIIFKEFFEKKKFYNIYCVKCFYLYLDLFVFIVFLFLREIYNVCFLMFY